MSLTTIRSDCDNGRTCPHVSAAGRETLVVQGYLIPGHETAQLGIPAGETAIEIPLSLLPELASEHGGLHVTDRGTVVFHGPAVSDPETLSELTIPGGEAAIEIPAARLPFLEVAGHA
jgi:hypothetical protein